MAAAPSGMDASDIDCDMVAGSTEVILDANFLGQIPHGNETVWALEMADELLAELFP